MNKFPNFWPFRFFLNCLEKKLLRFNSGFLSGSLWLSIGNLRKLSSPIGKQSQRVFYVEFILIQIEDQYRFYLEFTSENGNRRYQRMRIFNSKGLLHGMGKLTWESAHAWILKILCYLIVWGITLILMVRLSFFCNSLANLWRHEWYHNNTLGYPVIIIFKVIDIICNGRRNVLLNSYIIEKFSVT